MSTFFVTIGLFIIIGAAGSTDINAISLTQAMSCTFIGVVIIAIGVLCSKPKAKGGKLK